MDAFALMRTYRFLLRLLPGLFAAAVMLTACGAPQQAAPVEQPLDEAGVRPTPVIAGNPAAQATALPQVTPQHVPLELNFPTPGPIPVSRWRAPLYEAPFALGPYDHFYFTRPIAADEVNWPLADYRYGYNFPGTDAIHTGVDIDARIGTPVRAAADGEVIWTGYGYLHGDDDPNDPYGLAVAIQHDFGHNGKRLITVYGHMDRIDVIPHQRVHMGDALGIVGNTGMTTGPHLHFEVRLQGDDYYFTRNPELWLAPPQGSGVLLGRLFNTNGSILDGQLLVVTSDSTGRRWEVLSYAGRLVFSDDHYRENLVLSDLPAGRYTLTADYLGDRFSYGVDIRPGAITTFTFRGANGFNTASPPPPSMDDWLPEN